MHAIVSRRMCFIFAFHLCTCLDAFACLSSVLPQGRSIRALQRESQAAREDGADLSELALFGDLGCKGKWPQNVERDLERRARRKFRFPDLYMVQTSCTTLDGTPGHCIVGVILPHELFAMILHYEAAHLMFGGVHRSTQSEYWGMVERNGEDWWRRHPLREKVLRDPARALGVRLWGDDAPVGKKGRQIRVVSWAGVACKVSADVSKFPCYIIDPDIVGFDGEQRLLHVVQWSLTALATGIFPTHGPFGQPFSDGDRASHAGKPLASGNDFGVFVESGGDWPYLVQLYDLLFSMHTEDICWECGGCKSDGPHNYADVRENAGWLGTERTVEQLLSHMFQHAGRLPVLMQTPGWHQQCLVHDILHDDLLGVSLNANGSGIILLASHDWFGARVGGKWHDALNVQLGEAYRRFKKWTKDHRVCHSVKRFKHTSLGLATLSDWPTLRAKGKNSAAVSLWLAAEAREASQSIGDHVLGVLDRMLHGFSVLWCLYTSGNLQFVPRQVRQLIEARSLALENYHWLALHFSEHQAGKFKSLFLIQPKLHKLDHCLRRSARTRYNPGWHWTMADEDFIGLVARLVRTTHRLTVNYRAVQRWLWTTFMNLASSPPE